MNWSLIENWEWDHSDKCLEKFIIDYRNNCQHFYILRKYYMYHTGEWEEEEEAKKMSVDQF